MRFFKELGTLEGRLGLIDNKSGGIPMRFRDRLKAFESRLSAIESGGGGGVSNAIAEYKAASILSGDSRNPGNLTNPPVSVQFNLLLPTTVKFAVAGACGPGAYANLKLIEGQIASPGTILITVDVAPLTEGADLADGQIYDDLNAGAIGPMPTVDLAAGAHNFVVAVQNGDNNLVQTHVDNIDVSVVPA